MTFVFGVFGALLSIVGFTAGFFISLAETADKRAGRVASPADEEWAGKVKIGLRVAFWGGLLMMWFSAMASASG
jgi:hypothetical protein